ncbi:acyl-CoA reductase [Rheinheimera texasensis]|uniref:acyl-CoA reductase n=1 Tax=Rheinheimera texasensis TaxID=306205 RepID=UPI0032B29740
MTLSAIRLLAPQQSAQSIEHFCQTRTDLLTPFSAAALEFVETLSRQLLREPAFKAHPEMIALGYWLRKANISRLAEQAAVPSSVISHAVRLPRGLVFHVAPSNVDTIFIYSLVISLLMGNKNLVRLSSKSSAQQQLILQVLNQALTALPDNPISQSLLVVTYPHDDGISRTLSGWCDARMLWGGDQTVGYFSSLPVRPTAVDIKFANKYSLALLSAEAVLAADDAEFTKLVRAFVSDTYLFAQQACSSPRSVCWLGDDNIVNLATAKFWPAVNSAVSQYPHGLIAADFMQKLVFVAEHAIGYQSELSPVDSDLTLTVLNTALLGLIDTRDHCGRGTFLQAAVSQLSELNAVLHRGVQTLTYFGISAVELQQWLQAGVPGLDRLVPVGQGLDFDYIWDGVDLFSSLSRLVTIR